MSEPQESSIRMVTQRMVAEKAGVSQVTVSRALKNDARLLPETRERIQKIAEEMGYRSNPFVASLMSSLRDKRSRNEGTTIAYITEVPRDHFQETFYYNRFLEGAKARAKELGYSIEPFWLNDKHLTDDALKRIFRARSIYGILIGNGWLDKPLEYKLKWENYALVRIGDIYNEIRCHCADNDQISAVDLAFENIRSYGYQRIGYITAGASRKTSLVKYEMAIRQSLSQSAPEDQISICNPIYIDHKVTLEWFEKEKPEVIISNNPLIISWLEEAGYKCPQDFQFVNIDMDPSSAGKQSGILQNYEGVAAAAIDLLDNQLLYNERGFSANPKKTTLGGTWSKGETLIRKS